MENTAAVLIDYYLAAYILTGLMPEANFNLGRHFNTFEISGKKFFNIIVRA